MKKRIIAVSFSLLFALPALAGPVFIDGGDRDDHGSFNGTINLNGWKYIEQAVNFLYTNASNGGTGILIIGASSTALAAAQSAATKLGLATTVVTGAAITSANFSAFRVLYVPSDGSNTSGGISDADLALLTARKTDVQNFVNTGGGLFALTEAGATSPYSWLELPQPFTITTSFTDDTNLQTPELAAAGFTITNVELQAGTPTHNRFTGPPGFNGLKVFVVDANQMVITLGGGAATQIGVLNISKSGPATANVGDDITYTITYGNTGSSGATGVVITDPVPAGTTFVSADNGGTNVAGVVTWNIGTVAAGASGLTVHFTVHINSGPTVTNTAYQIQSGTLPPVVGPNVVTTIAAPPTPSTPVPTLSTSMLGLLALALAAAALVMMRR